MSFAPAAAGPADWKARWPALANAATVGTLTSAAKLAAAVKIAVTARFFGAGDELDAFLTAFIIPSMFGDAVAAMFAPSLVPAIIRVRAEQGPASASRLVRAAAALATLLFLGIALFFAAASPWILPTLGLSFSEPKLHLTAILFFGLLCWLPLGALIASWRAVLNAHGQFALAAAAPLASPALSIAFLYGGAARWGIKVLAAATIAGLVVELILLAAAIRRLGYPLLPGTLHWTPELRAVFTQFYPLMFGAITMSASLLIDQTFAGALSTGSVSALAYGSKLPGVVIAIVAAGMATAVLPEFSRFAAVADWSALRRAAASYSVLAGGLMIPVTALMMWFSLPLARLFYERGAFGPNDTQLVASVQTFAMLEIPLAVVFAVVSRLATSVGANTLVAQVGVAGMAVNVLADWWFSKIWGIAGLALSTGLVRAVMVVALVMLLYRREPRLFREAA